MAFEHRPIERPARVAFETMASWRDGLLGLAYEAGGIR